MAKGVLAAAKEKGIHIGENCKFAVYDYEGTENVISVRQNLSLMAEKAVDRLIERIEEPEKLMPAGNFYITPLVEKLKNMESSALHEFLLKCGTFLHSLT